MKYLVTNSFRAPSSDKDKAHPMRNKGKEVSLSKEEADFAKKNNCATPVKEEK